MTAKMAISILMLCWSGASGIFWNTANRTSSLSCNWQLRSSSLGVGIGGESGDFFSAVRNTLGRKTHIPLRLPKLELAYKDTSGLFAILEDGSPDHYYVQIALTDDCPGGNYCHIGSVIGSISPISVKSGPKIPVKLDAGISGFFVDADCGAHCDDSSINWREGKFYYSINLKAEKKETMVKLADSAIGHHVGR